MDPFTLAFTAGYLGNLGATLSGNILSEAGRGIKRVVSGEEIEQAFNRCIQTGIVAVARSTVSQAPEKTELLKGILDRFFKSPDVGGELSEILNGRAPDHDELTRLFEEAGYDPETLPGIQFGIAIDAFAAAFLSAAALEPQLQPVIQTNQLLAQTRIQKELLETMKALAAFLKERRPDAIGIHAETIIAQNVVSGQQYHFTPGTGQEPPEIKKIRIDKSQVGVIGDHTTIQGDIHFHSAPKPDDNSATHDARLRYLKDLASETNLLPWGRLSPEEAGPAGKKQNLRLADIYISLDTTEMERMDTEDDIRLHFKQKEEMKRISAQEMIDDNDRLVLLGDPGSGKTTLVNFLAHTLACACGDEDPDACMVHLEKIGRWSHGLLFPVRVVLRRFAEWCAGGGDIEDGLLGYIRHTLEKYDPLWPDVHKALQDESTPVFVLLDGLDEVAADDRQGIVAAIDRFVDQYPDNRYLATCRIYAYVDERYRLSRFRQTVLAPFDEDQVKGFIEAWYAELVRQGHLDPETGEQQSSKLISAVKQRGLMELAERPLLMTVMALLHTSYGQLPEDRIELYQWTVDLLFRRWKGHIGGENSLLDALDMPQLRMTDLEAGLYHAAFDAHAGHGDAEGTADIPELTLLKGLKPYLGNYDKAETFVHYVRERAGLLIRHKTDAYTFPHRTFQEFMAACHLVRMKDYPKEAASLVKNDPDRWRIVFVLAAGLARKHQPGNAISSVGRLCPAGVSETASPDGSEFTRADIAAEALLEIGLMEIERDDEGVVLLDRIKKWLLAAIKADSILKPKERVYSGNLLSQLGDPRFNPKMFHLPADDHLGFVEIASGEFLMGSDKNRDRKAMDRELPQHTLDLPVFRINRHPVTVAQFRAFVESSGRRPGNEKSLRGIDNHPVVWVSWHEAMAYCKWLTDALKQSGNAPESIASLLKKGWRISLPSEAEWEKAARGSDGRKYPWGENADPNKANYDDTGSGGTSPVGCFPGGRNPLGLLDMAGNVWEWTRSIYKDYPYRAEDGREDESSGANRVLRGGSWFIVAGRCRTASRGRGGHNKED